MTDLKCKVTNCVYNENYLCEKNEILVKGSNASQPEETFCESFRDLGSGAKNNVTGYAVPDTMIQCSAVTCTYNEHEKCFAKRIQIDGVRASQSEGTLCSSFEPKQGKRNTSSTKFF